MKILRLASYCHPEQIASSHLAKDLQEAYEKAGIVCEIHTPTPCRGIDAETRKKYKKIKYEELNGGYVQIHRYAMFKEPKNSILRAFRYTLCIIRGFFAGLGAKDVDVYYASSTPPINGLIMALLKKFKKYKIVYSLQDIFPDSLVNTGMTKKGSIIWKIGRWVENVTYNAADKIIVISEDFKKNIMEKGVPEEKIELVYNWVDENTVVHVDRENNPLFDKYGLDREKFYVCYSGNVGHTQNMEMLCDIAKDLESENPDIGFVIVGEGAFKPKLEEIIKEREIKNITLIPFQDYKDISCVFSLGDCGLIISKKGVGTNSVPSKTWSIMSASNPVLASFDKGSELDKIITETSCGICAEADDKEALKKAILDMYENKDQLQVLGANGRKFILKNLTKDVSTGKIINVLKGVKNA